MSQNYHVFRPQALGVNGLAFNASTNSTAFGVEGFNQLELTVSVTRVAATDISFYLEFSEDGTNWGRVQIEDLDPSTGISTLRARQFVKPLTGSITYVCFLPVLGKNMRIGAIVGTAAGATDLVTMTARLGVV